MRSPHKAESIVPYKDISTRLTASLSFSRKSSQHTSVTRGSASLSEMGRVSTEALAFFELTVNRRVLKTPNPIALFCAFTFITCRDVVGMYSRLRVSENNEVLFDDSDMWSDTRAIRLRNDRRFVK